MRTTLVLLLVCALLFCSCTHRSAVQCLCHGNGKENSYDLGIQDHPSASANATRCDTLGAHDGLDTCNLLIMGNK